MHHTLVICTTYAIIAYINHQYSIFKGKKMPEIHHREEEPPSRQMKRYWKIAILANIKDDDHPKPEGVPPDAFADFYHIETVDALRAALEPDGHKTVFIQADRDLPLALTADKPDIC